MTLPKCKKIVARKNEGTDERTEARGDEEVATQNSFVSLNMVLDKNVFRIETSKV